MKQKLKLVTIVMAIMILVMLPMSISKAENGKVSEVPEKSDAFKQWEELPEEEKKNYIQPSYTNLLLKDSVKRSTLNILLGENSTLDSKYDLRTVLNNNIKTKNQKQTNSCWAFSYTSMLETTMANKYKKTGLEYSPMHIDYKMAEIFNRKIGEGGGYLISLPYSASGYGPVNESDFKFDSVYDETKNSAESYYLSDMNTIDLNKEAKARVTNATIFANIFKVYDSASNKITYRDSNSMIDGNEYSEEQVNAIRNKIKKHIKENGAVSGTFYADGISGITADGNYTSIFYNNDNDAYCKTSFTNANHAVTIVGWDDTFSKDNFNTNYKPVHDGAYIVLNSWGELFGDNGFFYVSYDDASIEQAIYGVSDIDETYEYDRLYEYDQLGCNYGLYSVNEEQTKYLDSGYAANVYSRDTSLDKYEYLTEVGVFLLSTEGVEVYVNSSDDNKENAFLVASYTGNNALETGYHTLKLPAPLLLTGSKYTIIIKYVNSDKASIPIECNLLDSGLTDETYDLYNKATSNAGESFISANGKTWDDLSNCTYRGTTLKNSSACIKAMTMNSDELLTTPVTGVELDKTNVSMEVGDKVTLSASITPTYATNKNVTWTSSDETIATVNNGIVTALKEGEATITVTTEDGNKVATSKITVTKKTNTADDIYKDDINANGGQSIKEVTSNGIANVNNGDATVAKTILPYTGTTTVILIGCFVLVSITIVIAIRIKNLKDI